ncbi:MAG: nucleotidyltransferase domain-containing protein [Verrucomicrobia bacterium]|nr:nucleotidyltransferase domain-containing protein [Verrucomicrobiota bacterium]
MIAGDHGKQVDLTHLFGERNHELIDRIVAALRQTMPVEEIWIFGSCARGEADPGSDLDLLVVLPDDHGLARPTLESYRAIQRLHSGVPIDVVATTRSTWERDRRDGFGLIGDAFREGIRLYGHRREESRTLV